MLACDWRRISQEEAFVGRAAEVEDEMGSRLIAARLARELMRMCFLLQREYWPHTKWFGTSFARLRDDDGLSEALGRVVDARDHEIREQGLVDSYERLAVRHNGSELTAWVDPTVRRSFGIAHQFLSIVRVLGRLAAALWPEGIRHGTA